MAYDDNGEWYEDEGGVWTRPEVEEHQEQPVVAEQPPGQAGNPAYDANPRDYMIKQDSPSWEAQLKQIGGDLYDKSDLEGVKRQVSYAQNAGQDPQKFIDAQKEIYEKRRNNTPGQSSSSSSSSQSRLLGPSPSGGGGGSSSGESKPNKIDDVYGYLKGLFPGGAMNTDIINRRLDSVRSGLDSARKSTTKNNEAYLAEHGLAGSGPQASANENMESRLFGQFGSAYNDIYADESQNADKRMMTALTTAAGLSEAEAEDAIANFRANTERDLGFGNLAARNKEADQSYDLGQGNLNLGRTNANNSFILGSGNLAALDRNNTNNYNLGAGRLQLDRDQLAEIIRSGDADRLQKYLDMLTRGAETSSNGHY